MKEKKFTFKENYYKAIKEMTDKQAGEFIKTVCAFVFEGKPMITKDAYLKGLYVYIEKDFEIAAQNRLNAKKGAEKRAAKQKEKAALGVLLDSVVIAAENKKKAEQ